MIPISIIFKGIYSYEKEVHIDFSTLSEEGIFGIFGKVGSGKSAIIEAMSIALYGQTERFNKMGLAANVLNLKAREAYIILEFENFKGLKYKTLTRLIASKSDRKTVRRDFKIQQFTEGNWENCTKKIEEIIGLSYNNFKRTILIPQGQFREFIELRPRERNDMMQELFQLERFDLSAKVNILLSDTSKQEEYKKGNLNQLNPYAEINTKEKKKNIFFLKEKIKKNNSKIENLEKQHHRLMLLKEDWLKWTKQSERLKILENQAADFVDLDKKLKEHTLFRDHVLYPLNQWKETTKEIRNRNENLDSIQNKFTECNNEKIQTEAAWKDAKVKESDWPKKEQIIKEYTYLIAVQSLIREKNQLELEIANSKKTIEKANRENNDKIKFLEDIENKINYLEENKADLSKLLLVQDAFRNYNNLLEVKNKIDKQRKELEGNIQTLKEAFTQQEYTVENWQKLWLEKQKILKEKLNKQEEKIKDLEIRNKIQHFGQHLVEGAPCVLCGSTEHPQPIKIQDELEKEIKNSMYIQEEFKKEIEKNQEIFTELEIKHQKLLELENSLKIIKKESEEKELQLRNMLNDSKLWNNFRIEEEAKLLQAIEQIKREEEQIKNWKISYKEEQDNLKKLQNELKDLENKQRPILNKIAENTGRIHAAKEHIAILNWDWAEEYSKEFLEQKKLEEQDELFNEKKQLKTLEHKKDEINQRFTQLSTEKSILKKELQKLEKREKLQKALILEKAQIIKKHSLEEIIAYGQSDFDIKGAQEKLNDYYSEIQALQKHLKEYSSEAKTFKEEDLQNIIHELNVLKQEQSKDVQYLAVEEKDLKHIIEQQKKHAIEKKALEKIEKRKNNLQELRNLFQGKAFVRYASAYWLKRLVHFSNKYFEKLTHNQLSINLNNDLDFEIIDYLNGGQSRVLQSLSGGQSFQVSLSLALALAESVQANLNAEKQFFFIDEGFGTLDQESIEEVYNTLLKLTSKNKNIGIISHVQALQEQIPKRLHIVKSEDTGSYIQSET